jgi:riboflavin kinase/FMN adenylyltransferase
MTILRTIDEARARLTRSVVTIGNFDGVHRGHQRLLDIVAAQAARLDATPVALTFEPHPVRFFDHAAPDLRLTTLTDRARLLTRGGAEVCVALAFDHAMAALSPEAFFQQILVEGLAAAHIVVGEDFHFGSKRRGTPEVLRALCEAAGVGLTLVPPVLEAGLPVSSTRVRQALTAADLPLAHALLGRPWAIEGEVIHGDARGRELGFPTANVACDNPLMPPDGIFVTTLVSERFGALPAITYIGQRPTFGDGPRTVETFVLNWRDERPLDLYAQIVRIDFHTFLRPDARYESAQLLMEQMARDVAAARAHFGLNA